MSVCGQPFWCMLSGGWEQRAGRGGGVYMGPVWSETCAYRTPLHSRRRGGGGSGAGGGRINQALPTTTITTRGPRSRHTVNTGNEGADVGERRKKRKEKKHAHGLCFTLRGTLPALTRGLRQQSLQVFQEHTNTEDPSWFAVQGHLRTV